MSHRTTRTALAVATALALPIAGGALPAQAAPATGTTAPAQRTPALAAGTHYGTAPLAPRLVTGIAVRSTTTSTRAAALAFLAAHPGLQVAAPTRTLRPAGSTTLGGVTAERFDQVVNGVPVLGGQYVVRLRADGKGTTVVGTGGSYFRGLTVSTTATVSAKGATRQVRLAAARAGLRVSSITDRGLVVLPVGTGRLAHRVALRGTAPLTHRPLVLDVVVDARTGAVLGGWDRMQSFAPTTAAAASPALAPAADPTPTPTPQPIPTPTGPSVTTTGKRLTTLTVPLVLTKTAPNTFAFVDASRAKAKGSVIRTFDAAGADVLGFLGSMPATTKIATTGAVPVNAAATRKGTVDAHWAAAKVYDYYKSSFGRNGIDGQGGTMDSVVGVTLGGQAFPNAFWDGTKMVYGGGGQGWRPFSAGLDVVGHEMTHGVVERTAGLLYFGEPGALNEAMADYFGNAVQDDTEGIAMHLPEASLLGEDLCAVKSKQACAMRDLNDKRTTWQDYEGVLGDNAGVHVNSTIASGALWDIRKRLGGPVADKLAYAALTQYLSPTATFVDLRDAVLAAATDQRLTPSARAVVASAFKAHGIVDGWDKEIGVDSTALMKGLTQGIAGFGLIAGPDAGSGRWAAAHIDVANPDQIAIYGGATNAPGSTRRLSPNDGSVPVALAVDGRTTVWADTDAEATTFRVRAMDTTTGQITTVATTKQGVVAVGVSGTTVMWTTVDFDKGTFAMHAKIGSGPERTVALPGQLMFRPGVAGTTGSATVLVIDMDKGEISARSLLVDLATGKTADVPTPAASGDGALPGIAAAVITPKGLVTVEAGDLMGTAYSVVRRPRTGLTLGAPTTLSDGTAEEHLAVLDIDATDQAVSAVTDPGVDAGDMTGYTNASTPKILQVPATGGTWKRMSCNRGEQGSPAADTGTRVVWVDGTTGTPALMTRPKPAGTC